MSGCDIIHALLQALRAYLPLAQGVYYIVFAICLQACSMQQDDPKEAFDSGAYARAYNLWSSRANQGDARAQNYLGIQYQFGLYVPQDPVQAARWYGVAARQGYADAQRNYGALLYHGIGVKQDFYAAFFWFLAASRQGNKRAKKQLNTIMAENKLTPNQQMRARLEVGKFVFDLQAP